MQLSARIAFLICIHFAHSSDKGFGGGGGTANSVSFRHGTNVEFEGPSFVARAAGAAAGAGSQEPKAEFRLDTVSSSEASSTKKRDFSNPMYDMETQAEMEAAAAAAVGNMAALSSAAPEPAGSSAAAELEPPSAVIAPSSVTQRGSPAQIRHRQLAPSAIDTGKDTQCLVEDGDDE